MASYNTYLNEAVRLPDGVITHPKKYNQTWRRGGNFVNDGNVDNATVLYEVREGSHNTWIYNFYLWYNWNGCVNLYLKNVKIIKMLNYFNFNICNYGEHEGDLEKVVIQTCRSDQPRNDYLVQVSQHDWNNARHCSPNNENCRFVDNQTNLELFIGLYSHALYFQPFPPVINAEKSEKLFSISLIDLLEKGPRFWNPNAQNLVYVNTTGPINNPQFQIGTVVITGYQRIEKNDDRWFSRFVLSIILDHFIDTNAIDGEYMKESGIRTIFFSNGISRVENPNLSKNLT